VNNIGNRFRPQRLVSVVKFINEPELEFRDDENVGSPRNFFQKDFQNFFQTKLQKLDAIFLVTGFATVLQIAIHCQIPYCNIKFCNS